MLWSTKKITERQKKLEASVYLREQLQRVMPLYCMAVGTVEAQPFEALLTDVAMAVAIFQENEVTPDPEFKGMITGPIVVVRSALNGYDLLVRAATVSQIHLDLSDRLKDPA